MILFDTNVLSELMRSEPDPAVVAFLDGRPRSRLYTTTIVQAELLSGIALMPLGRRREAIEARAQLLFDTKFPGRVLPFDENAAAHYGAIMSMRRAIGRPLEGFDGLIAAVARARDAIVATRNARDFDGCGIKVLNPWANPG